MHIVVTALSRTDYHGAAVIWPTPLLCPFFPGPALVVPGHFPQTTPQLPPPKGVPQSSCTTTDLLRLLSCPPPISYFFFLFGFAWVVLSCRKGRASFASFTPFLSSFFLIVPSKSMPVCSTPSVSVDTPPLLCFCTSFALFVLRFTSKYQGYRAAFNTDSHSGMRHASGTPSRHNRARRLQAATAALP